MFREVKVLGLVCAVVAATVVLSACGGSHRARTEGPVPPPRAQISAQTVRSSGFILNGRVVCTATATRSVGAGDELSVSLALHNVSGSTVKAPIEEGSTWLVARTADGTTYDTRTAIRDSGSLGGPARMPVAIRPGATAKMGTPAVLVAWNGPLRITPGCETNELPALPVKVTAPGAPSNARAAIAAVVAATGGVLDHCRPAKSGVAVDGKIDPPTGNGSPMDARCVVRLHAEGRFVVAQLLIVIPRGMRGVHVGQPYETLSFPAHKRPYEVIAWEFVVTKKGAVTVAGFTHAATRAGKRLAPQWVWTGSSWGQPGASKCGFEGFGGGPGLDLISVCP